jgi:hypothetical protein
MPFGQTQQELDQYRIYDDRVEELFANRVELGKLEAEIKGVDSLDETDRQSLLGRINQYILDMDKSAAMSREQDLMPEEGNDANA